MILTLCAVVSGEAAATRESALRKRLLRIPTSSQTHITVRSFGWLSVGLALSRDDASIDPWLDLAEGATGVLWGRSPWSQRAQRDACRQALNGTPRQVPLEGEYCLFLLDHRGRRCRVLRDALGTRSTFWTEQDSTCWLSTDERCLQPAAPHADADYLASFFAGEAPPPGRTPVEGVRELPPGHYVDVTPHGPGRPQRYFTFHYQPEARRLRGAAAVEAVSATLTGALRRSGSDGSVLALSGGLDSPALAACGEFAAAATYALPAWPPCDESALAADVARQVGLPLTTVNCDQLGPLSVAFYATPRASVGPELDAYQALRQALWTAAREQGHKVVTTGDFADHLYLGYPYALRDRFWAAPGSTLRAALRRGRRRPAFWRDPLLRRMLPANGLSRRWRRGHPPWLTPAARRRLGLEPHHPLYGPVGQVDRVEGCLSTAAARAAHLGLLQAQDAGVALRFPYRDPELVQLLLSLPADCLYDPLRDRTKAVLRDAMAARLPPAVVQRRDKTTLEPVFRQALLRDHRKTVAALLAQYPAWREFVEPAWLDGVRARDKWSSSELYVLWCCLSFGLRAQLAASGQPAPPLTEAAARQ